MFDLLLTADVRLQYFNVTTTHRSCGNNCKFTARDKLLAEQQLVHVLQLLSEAYTCPVSTKGQLDVT